MAQAGLPGESGPCPWKHNQDRRSDWGTRRSTLQDDETPIVFAVMEGRRIYRGNIFYHIRAEQISEAMKKEGFENIERIHISVDPVTRRNLGYCFVESDKRETAEAAISRTAGVKIEGRALHTGPCHPKKRAAPRRFQQEDEPRQPTFERWRKERERPGPIGAEDDHLVEMVETSQRSRVYAGGLGRMINQAENDEKLRTLFDGFKM